MCDGIGLLKEIIEKGYLMKIYFFALIFATIGAVTRTDSAISKIE